MNCVDDPTRAYTQLQPDQILTTLEQLGFRCSGRLLALNSYENRVYKVGLEDMQQDSVVAKFYRPGRWSDAAILEEHAFSEELAAQDIPVVPPLEIGGETLFTRGAFRLAVYDCHGGRPPELDDRTQLRQLGRLVARIHLVGTQADFHDRPALDVDSFGIASRDFLLDAGFIPEEMRDVYSDVAERVIDGTSDCGDRCGAFQMMRLHGDCHPSNILIAGDAFHIVDLDDARSGPAVQDLWMFLSGNRDEQTPQLASLLDGYQEFRAFDARELHLIEALRSLRIMHYAAWLARRWDDPAFKNAFPWFNTRRYWDEHILTLREQLALMQEPPLEWTEQR